jgi:hypothetical protein
MKFKQRYNIDRKYNPQKSEKPAELVPFNLAGVLGICS